MNILDILRIQVVMIINAKMLMIILSIKLELSYRVLCSSGVTQSFVEKIIVHSSARFFTNLYFVPINNHNLILFIHEGLHEFQRNSNGVALLIYFQVDILLNIMHYSGFINKFILNKYTSYLFVFTSRSVLPLVIENKKFRKTTGKQLC